MPQDGPDADVSVRPARADDATAIGRAQALTWQAAYAELIPAEQLTRFSPDALAASWRAAITDPPTAAHRLLVALAAGELVGFAAVSPSDAPTSDEARVGELVALVVSPQHWRQGHGSRLLNAAADTLRDNGFDTLAAWAPEVDEARIAFLSGAGMVVDGAVRTLDLSGDGQSVLREVRLVAALTRS